MFTSDLKLIAFTKTALRVYLAALFMMGIQMACQMTFNSLGRAVESIIVAIMRKFVLLLPLIFVPVSYTHLIALENRKIENYVDMALYYACLLYTSIIRKKQWKRLLDA